ncbi:MAG: hypothetical protein R3A12_04865 [Ignavibacteria bacterium]
MTLISLIEAARFSSSSFPFTSIFDSRSPELIFSTPSESFLIGPKIHLREMYNRKASIENIITKGNITLSISISSIGKVEQK